MTPSARTPVVGLTGSIASGKSTVASMLCELGVGVVDADAVAREVVAPGTEGLREIVQAFGEGVLDRQGGLDRERMSQIVFADPEARKELESITHPRIGRRSAERLAELALEGRPYVVYEAPLLLEVGAHLGLDAVLVVTADTEDLITRASQRDGTSREAVTRRLDAQWPLEKKLSYADYVVENTGTLSDLRDRVDDVHVALLARFGKASSSD